MLFVLVAHCALTIKWQELKRILAVNLHSAGWHDSIVTSDEIEKGIRIVTP
jgi:hypothetical protein